MTIVLNKLGEQAKRPIDTKWGKRAKRPIDKKLGEQAKRPIDKKWGKRAKRPIDKKSKSGGGDSLRRQPEGRVPGMAGNTPTVRLRRTAQPHIPKFFH